MSLLLLFRPHRYSSVLPSFGPLTAIGAGAVFARASAEAAVFVEPIDGFVSSAAASVSGRFAEVVQETYDAH